MERTLVIETTRIIFLVRSIYDMLLGSVSLKCKKERRVVCESVPKLARCILRGVVARVIDHKMWSTDTHYYLE